jgi:hypothetical protein
LWVCDSLLERNQGKQRKCGTKDRGRTSSIFASHFEDFWFAHRSGGEQVVASVLAAKFKRPEAAQASRIRGATKAAPAEVTKPVVREKSQRSLEENVNTSHVRRRWQSFFRGNSIGVGAALAAAWLLSPCATRHCSAALIVLTNGGSTVTIDPTGSPNVENWSIGGKNQLNEEDFWIRTGSTGGQSSIATLSGPTITPGLPSNMADLIYGSSNGLEIDVVYTLNPSGSDLAETIEINNDGTSSQTYHFFEYANFNLGDSITGQVATISGANTATDVGNGWQVQTVVSSPSSEFEANDYPTLLNSVSSSTTPSTLTDASPSAAGDAEWGFEWDKTLAPGGSYPISVDENFTAVPVPEPVNGLIAVLGLSGLSLMRSRRQDSPTRTM